MAGNSGVHRVTFKNETTETVTFVVESTCGHQTAFTLIPKGPAHYEEVQTPLTHETLRLVVGENSSGQFTNECVSTDELAGLDEVVVTLRENPGNNPVNKFLLKKKKTNEGTSPWRRWFRNEGAPRNPTQRV